MLCILKYRTQLQFFCLLALDWILYRGGGGKKYHKGRHWVSWQKWNMDGKVLARYFFKVQADPKGERNVIFSILITTPNPGEPRTSLFPPQLSSSQCGKISRKKTLLLPTRQKQRHTKVKQAARGCLRPHRTGQPRSHAWNPTWCADPPHTWLTPQPQTGQARARGTPGASQEASKPRQHGVKRPVGRKTEAALEVVGESNRNPWLSDAGGTVPLSGGSWCLCKECSYRMDTPKLQHSTKTSKATTGVWEYLCLHLPLQGGVVRRPPEKLASKGRVFRKSVCLVDQGIPVFRDPGIQDRSWPVSFYFQLRITGHLLHVTPVVE